jgi:hypothetical protein
MFMRRMLRASGLAVFAASVLTAGSLAIGAPAALAGPCGSAVPAGTTCSMTGTVTLTGGTLSLTSPASLTWNGTLTGSAQSLVDVLPGDQQLTVLDATGTGAGWHITTAATTFTSGSNTFPNIGTFVFNGSTGSVTSASAPTAACVVALACTVPTNTSTYPVAITTAPAAPSPSMVYDTATGTGIGAILIGGSAAADPVGWWVNVPATAIAGIYTSTITMEIISGP